MHFKRKKNRRQTNPNKFSFDDIQQAFIDERITLEQFIEVLIDNFGAEKTAEILDHNIKLAEQQQENISLSK